MLALWVRDRLGAMTIRIDAAGRQWASWDDPSLDGPYADPDPVLKAKVQQHGFPGAITKLAPRLSTAGASASPPPAASGKNSAQSPPQTAAANPVPAPVPGRTTG